MKLFLPTLAIFLLTCIAAHSAVPDKVIIKARKGDITFPHKRHIEAGHLKDCSVCHSSETIFKIGKQGMEKGHAICKACHSEMEAGPRDCDGCHK